VPASTITDCGYIRYSYDNAQKEIFRAQEVLSTVDHQRHELKKMQLELADSKSIERES